MNGPTKRTEARSTDPLVAVVGCGAVGRALAHGLWSAGFDLVLSSRTLANAEALARDLAGARVSVAPDAVSAAGSAPLTLLAVADDALAEVADLLAGCGARTVLHTNGTRGLEVLEPLRRAGWAVGKLHPLVAVPAGAAARGDVFRDQWFATLGERGAREWIDRLLEALGARGLKLRAEPDASARMHAAATLVSGGMVALFAAAQEVAHAACDDPQATAAALSALLAGTLRNIGDAPPAQALTGPVARGSVDLVRAHLAILEATPAAAEAYRVLGRQALALTDLPAAVRHKMAALLA